MSCGPPCAACKHKASTPHLSPFLLQIDQNSSVITEFLHLPKKEISSTIKFVLQQNVIFFIRITKVLYLKLVGKKWLESHHFSEFVDFDERKEFV